MKNSKLATYAERLRSLPPKKRALLEKKLRAEGIDLTQLEITPRPGPRGRFPLSFSQQRLWFLHQLDPTTTAYNISIRRQLFGRLDPKVLERALSAIVDRHEVLRTSFEMVDGEPLQVVRPELSVGLPVVDLSRLPGAGAERELLRVGAEVALRPFDLERGPVLRTALARLTETCFGFFVTVHHIAADNWSLGIFFRELLTLAEAFAAGREPSLPPLPIQYADFAVWQRQRLTSGILAEQLEYWRGKLGDGVAKLQLPTDRPRGALRTRLGRAVSLPVAPAMADALRALARGEEATLSMLFLAAFKALLHRLTGQAGFAVGSTIANRNREEVEGLIGFFVNTLVLRTDLSGDPSFRQLLRRVRRVVLEADANQDLPFSKLVEELQPERDLDVAPLFQVSFNFLLGGEAAACAPAAGAPAARPRQAAAQEGMRAAQMPGQPRDFPFDLTLRVNEDGGHLSMAFDFKVALFDTTRVQRYLAQLTRLLGAAVADPETPLSRLPMWSRAELHQVLHEWNDTGRRRSETLTVHGLAAAAAARTPDAVALVDDASGRELSFGELDRRANQLARHLRRLGVAADDQVGLCLDRSPELAVGLLGILKAGAGTLPLDPGYPAERLAMMAEDAHMPVLVTEEAFAGILPETGARILRLDAESAAVAAESDADPGVPTAPENLCYAIYTSGSTGRPKGTLVTHRALCNRLLWFQETYRLSPDDRVLHKTPISFDVSVWEIFWPLTAGARVVLARPGGHQDPGYMVDVIERRAITTTHFVPSMLRLFLEQRDVERCGGLRRLVASGEALTVDLVRSFFARLPNVPMHNMYGPSEAARASFIAVGAAEALPVAPIGRPVPNNFLYVLDPKQRPVPLGVPGELCIGGGGLARGYHRRPALTAEKFVPDAQSDVAGARLYRTGDLVRFLADGRIEFLGRIDFQVKVRGMRVELGEIDAVLGQHPGVREAVVAVRELTPGDQRLVAYLVAGGETAPEGPELRAFLGEHLPEYMVPSNFVVLDAMPLTPSGKADRAALPDVELARAGSEPVVAPRNEVEETLVAMWRELLGVDEVGVEDNFFDLGGHSLLLVRLQSRLRETFERDVPLVELFRYPSISHLAGLLAADPDTAPEAARRPRRRRRERDSGSEIAVIGMSCRFPGADDVDAYWQNLKNGVESVNFFTDEEMLAKGVPAEVLANPLYVKARAGLEDIELFDAPLFAVNPREAQTMDPQQRIFLECAWQALENAGYDPSTYDGAIGVFAGVGPSRYYLNVLGNPELVAAVGQMQVSVGNEKDFLPTRVSYKLDLKGPGVNVQTACSTSLVATHLGCRSLLEGECDMVMAGGVQVGGEQRIGYLYTPDGISSPDGHCRSYDARAKGTVGANGAGIVVLKRLADALADGDHVVGVIKGSAINNDGSDKVGFTAPSIDGQAEVIREALTTAGVEPQTVGYIEGHGTATPLGDPIEVAALRQVFGTEPGERLGLGSVKSSFGHLGAAAGVAGLIKAVRALEHRQIPPSLHFEEPNPEIDFENSPIYVPTELRDWPADGGPRRAGVSSFGLGGTNVHAVLEEAPEPVPTEAGRPWQLLVLSAATGSALNAATDRLVEHLRREEALDFADAAFTAQVGRRRLAHRRVVVARDAADATEALAARDPRRLLESSEERKDRPVAFLFPGVGDHYVDMARQLYEQEPTFRDELDRCADFLAPRLGEDLREVLYPEGQAGEETPADGGMDLRRLLGRGGEASPASRRLDRTRLAQPAVFAIELALTRLWQEWGIEPAAMIGYSLGEYTAACVAGVLTPEDALALIADRAQLIDELPEGAMLAVPLAEEDVLPLLGEELSLAASNGPEVSIVAGPTAAVETLEQQLEERGLVAQRLASTHAFHSAMMRPIAERFVERVRQVELSPPRIPYVSNVTGGWITAEEATDPEYWARHLCQTVRFTEGLERLLADSGRVLLEVGPGQALATSARQHPSFAAGQLAVGSLRDAREQQSDVAFLLGALGRLWLAGAPVDWRGVHAHARRRRVVLPTYPFERQRYWVDPAAPSGEASAAVAGKDPEIANWFYAPAWKLSPPPRAAELAAGRHWLLFADDGGLGDELARRLLDAGQDVVLVRRGAAYDGGETLDPRRPQDYERLVKELREAERVPQHVVHLWNVAPTDAAAGDMAAFDEAQHAGLYSLVYLVRALAHQGVADELRCSVVSSGLHAVSAGDVVAPEKAPLVGLLRVLPQEYRNIHSRSIDIEPPAANGGVDAVAGRLMAELAGGREDEPVVAWRGALRRVEAYDPLPLPVTEGLEPGLRRGGVYLLVGGFGRVGRVLSHYLARIVAGARLVLTGRAPLPPRAAWDDHLARHGDEHPMSRKILQVRLLEGLGAEVLPLAAEATDRAAMAGAVEQARQRFGELHGVVYLAGLTQQPVAFEKADPPACQPHFAAKVEGLAVLEEVLGDAELDFCVLFGSLSAQLGGLGFAAYAAANTYLDAFARRHGQDGTPWLSIDWDGWPQHEEDTEVTGYVMTPEEAAEAFHRLLAMRAAAQLVVATGELPARLDRWVRFASVEEERERPAAGELFARPSLQTPYVEPRNETEEGLVEVWRELLGIGEIGAHDNFFELGGDSLLATQLVSRLRGRFRVELPLAEFFNVPTVGQLAERMQQGDFQQEELGEIADVLERIKDMSPEEAEEALRLAMQGEE